MKKILLFLILCGISFIPSFVYASTDTTLQLDTYPLSSGIYNTIFNWLNESSNSYLDVILSDYSYYSVYVSSYTNSSNYRSYTIDLYGANNEYFLQNTKGSNYVSGKFGPINTYYWDLHNIYKVYKDLNSNDWYSSSTFNDSTKITSLGLGSTTLTSTQGDHTQFSNNFYCFGNFSGCYSLTGNPSFNIYMNNTKLSSTTSRDILIYNNDSLEDILTINKGDIVSGYRDIFFDKPSYLNGYKKLTLDSNIQYYAISGINKGIVYVPSEYYGTYNPFLMYYQNGLEYQPYSNIITNTRLTSDMQYVAITFDFSNMSNIDLVMFSKYDYLEGVDNISYDIYIPNNAYTDDVSVIPNTNGGNDFNFNYSDLNGNISSESFSNYSEEIVEKNQLFNALFETFSNNYFGLNAIISRPLDLIASLSNATCEDIVLPLPYVNSNITLPCMDSIYSTYFGLFYDIYQDLISGFICYWILIDLVRLVKGFKDPAYDKIEVVNL